MFQWLWRWLPPRWQHRLNFAWRYWRGAVPWDTRQTPPEVIEWVEAHPPGRALDLGCGTGTNALYLARQGWEVTGIDFIPQPLQSARQRARGETRPPRFLLGDVTRLDELPLDGPFDLFLDIGCLHSLPAEGQQRYATQVARLARPGATLLLYAGLPRLSSTGLPIGLMPEEVVARFAPAFRLTRQQIGEDTGGGWQSGWYWLERAG